MQRPKKFVHFSPIEHIKTWKLFYKKYDCLYEIIKFLAIAISAPYEFGGTGAIYIYHGSELGPVCTQRIIGTQISPSISRFGLSLSRGVDFDRNGYADLAVGMSGQSAVLTSKPIVKLIGSLSSPIQFLTNDTANFQLKYCITLLSERSRENRLMVSLNVTLDDRTEPSVIHNIKSIYALKENCIKETIQLKPNNSNFNDMVINFEYGLEEKCSICPITNPNEKHVEQIKLTYIVGCKAHNNCKPNLTVSPTFEK